MSATCPIAALVAADIASRAAKGWEKYRQTLARTDMSLKDWLQMRYEELLDDALYTRRAIQMLEVTPAHEMVAAALVPDTPRPDMPQNGPQGRLEAGAGAGRDVGSGDGSEAAQQPRWWTNGRRLWFGVEPSLNEWWDPL